MADRTGPAFPMPQMPTLRVELFGGLFLYCDDVPLPPVPATAARSILAYLVIYRTRPHTRDLLAGTFWPDVPDAVARRRLSQALWQIRSKLEAALAVDVLQIDGDLVQINPDLSIVTDVDEFRRLVGPGVGGLPDRSTALPALQSAVDLYRGDLLAGYYDDWILTAREQLRDTVVRALERLVTLHKQQGEYEEALIHARRMLIQDPLREAVHREVMRLCHLLDRDHEALRQYEACRQVLADELGVEPARATRALAAEIAAHGGLDPVPHLPVVSAAITVDLIERPEQLPIVGRQTERRALASYVDLAARGCGSLVLLAGEPGVGKTRLMQEVARDAAWRGFGVAWGQSCDLAAPIPYQPLLQVLHDADLAALSPAWQGELAHLLPRLGSPPLPLASDQERSRLIEALARAFVALAHRGPQLVILEDVQWMDPASFEVVRLLLPRLSTIGLLVVVTLRHGELAAHPVARHALSALENTRLARRLDLAPLDGDETGVLIQRLLAMSHPAPRFSQRLYDRTSGNPFFVVETLRTLVDAGMLYRGPAGGWRTPWDNTTADYAELPVPRSIAAGIEQRLAQLAPPVLELIQIAAAAGCDEFDVWLAASGRGEEEMLAAVEDLARRALVVEHESMPGYRFSHDIIRHVLYESISPVRRRRYHQQIAAALESIDARRVEALAHHHRLGQNWPAAMHYAFLAGERAQATYANRQALTYYEEADAWLAAGIVPSPPDQVTRRRATLAERIGQVRALIGEYDAAEVAFFRARQLWAAVGDRRGEAQALNRLSFLCFIREEHAAATRYATEALDILESIQAHGLRAASLNYLGLSAWSRGKYDDALPPLMEALSLFEQSGADLAGLARCLNSLGLVHLDHGDLDLAEDYLSRSLVLRCEIGDRRGEGFCHYNQARVAIARHDTAASRRELDAARAIFGAIESAEGLAACERLAREMEGWQTRAEVRLARRGTQGGRPVHDEEYVDVTWTVATPDDEQIANKVSRRQHIVLRLLAQAYARDAVPTVDDLASALGVSRATIKRDLAALRAVEHQVETPGSKR